MFLFLRDLYILRAVVLSSDLVLSLFLVQPTGTLWPRKSEVLLSPYRWYGRGAGHDMKTTHYEKTPVLHQFRGLNRENIRERKGSLFSN